MASAFLFIRQSLFLLIFFRIASNKYAKSILHEYYNSDEVYEVTYV